MSRGLDATPSSSSRSFLLQTTLSRHPPDRVIAYGSLSSYTESMIKISFCMRRLPRLSREEFLTYWREKHPAAVPPEAISVLGIKRYIQVHTLETPARDLVVGPRQGLEEPLDGIAELWVESLEALERDWSSEQAEGILRAFFEDEQNFIDWSRSTILVSEELVMIP